MVDLVQTVEWEGKQTRLVKLGGLPQRGAGYTRLKNRRIEHVVVHQSDGPFTAGVRAPLGIARFHTGTPIYKTDAGGQVIYVNGKPKWIGGGRGWPGAGYQFCVSAAPEVQDGKFVVYRMHDDDVWSWHTGKHHNRRGVGVVVAGMYASRHAPGNDDARMTPDPGAVTALEELVLTYLLPRYQLDATDLLGHFDAGKAACPGDFLEQWVRHVRGEAFPDPREKLVIGAPGGAGDKRPLKTARQRQQALADLGYSLGPAGVDGAWGLDSKGALLAFQADHALVVDGLWGPRTEAAVRAALAETAE
jgi:hypothetical protein